MSTSVALDRPRGVDRRTPADLVQLADHVGFTWPTLPAPQVAAWSEDLVLGLDGNSCWIVGPAEKDPLRGRHGRSILPPTARARLNELAALRVPFRRVAIAHELDPDGPVKALLPELRSGSQVCAEPLASTLVGCVPVDPRTAGALHALEWATATPGRAARTDRSGLRRVLDPIVFGVVAPTTPRHGQPCLFYPLTAWRW